MFGNPLNDMMSSTKTQLSDPSPEALKLLEQVLDYIHANLVNIRNTWGAESVQYKSAAGIMDQYLEENTKRLAVKKPDLEELMKNMSLDNLRETDLGGSQQVLWALLELFDIEKHFR